MTDLTRTSPYPGTAEDLDDCDDFEDFSLLPETEEERSLREADEAIAKAISRTGIDPMNAPFYFDDDGEDL